MKTNLEGFRGFFIPSLLLLIVTLMSCGTENSHKEQFMVSEDVLQTVSQKNIFFAHQSVGSNILDGVFALAKETIDIREMTNGEDWSDPVFAHSTVGENTKPLSKIEDFKRQLHSGVGDNADIAFMKFCYVDFNRSTEVKNVFKAYEETLRSLEVYYPKVRFIHLTVPLMTQQVGIKAVIKRILGMEIYGARENLKRQEFNKLVRNSYDIVFDLAMIEATYPDGTLNEHVFGGEQYYSLVSDYTYDGGHLNKTGAKLVASELLKFLSEL